MEFFRLHNKKYPVELSGFGAAKFGARWNSKGTEVIYLACSRALALAEVVVHLNLSNLPSNFCMLTVFIPNTVAISQLDCALLNEDWNFFPESFSTQKIGDLFVTTKQFCILKVPSAVVKGDFNYVINPYHIDFDKIKIINQDDFPIDARLFKNLKNAN